MASERDVEARRHAQSPPVLPDAVDAFVGRSADLARICDALALGARVVTVVGPAGAGKTRTARRACALLREGGRFDEGIWLVELGAATSAAALLAAVVAALPWSALAGERVGDIEALAALSAERGRFLVVLDEVEPVLEGAAALVEGVCRRVPGASFLATSREPLGLRGELVLALDPLPEDDAVELFVARACAARADRSALRRARATLEELVARLDGNPLAIELAAARAEVLSPKVILARLDDRFELLRRPGGASGRHATLRSAIGWSWELLGERERSALAQLSVFATPFDLASAEAVLDDPTAALDLVHALVRKSFLRREGERFVVSESVRAFAAEKLVDPALVRGRKARHFRARTRLWGSGPTEEERSELLQSLPDWLGAIDDVSASDPRCAAELGCAVEAALYGRIPQDLHASIVAPTLSAAERAGASPLVASARVAEARGLRVAGDNLGAYRALEAARAVAPPGDPIAVSVLRLMGQIERHRGHVDEARRLLGQALDAELLALAGVRGPLLDDLGVVLQDAGQDDLAEQHYLDALAHHRRDGDRRYEGISRGHLGLVAHARGALDEAGAHYATALQIAEEVGDLRFEAFSRAFQAMIAFERGELQRARTTLTHAWFEASGTRARAIDPRAHALLASVHAVLVATRGDLPGAREILADARTRLGADCEGELGALRIVAEAVAGAAPAAGLGSRATASYPAPTCIEQRLALRLGAAFRARKRADETPGRLLAVGPEGRWFELDGGPRVSLARRRALQPLFAFLVRLREQRPGVGASWRELLAAGWPGEKVVASAGQRRAYVAIATLRSLGLAEVLLHLDDGYLLDPDARLRLAEPPNDL